jgi:hypothetical protein
MGLNPKKRVNFSFYKEEKDKVKLRVSIYDPNFGTDVKKISQNNDSTLHVERCINTQGRLIFSVSFYESTFVRHVQREVDKIGSNESCRNMCELISDFIGFFHSRSMVNAIHKLA